VVTTRLKMVMKAKMVIEIDHDDVERKKNVKMEVVKRMVIEMRQVVMLHSPDGVVNSVKNQVMMAEWMMENMKLMMMENGMMHLIAAFVLV
jgi:hypothetical protein